LFCGEALAASCVPGKGGAREEAGKEEKTGRERTTESRGSGEGGQALDSFSL